MELGYARVSTVKQDPDRQIDALEQAGIPRERIYVDKKSGVTTDRPRAPARPKHCRKRRRGGIEEQAVRGADLTDVTVVEINTKRRLLGLREG